MSTLRRFLFPGVVVVVFTMLAGACGETAAIDAVDASAQDGSIGQDASASDGAAGGDATREDAGDGGVTVDAGDGGEEDAGPVACTACAPDYCGCGACNTDLIVCTKDPPKCPLSCPTSCDPSVVKCGCLGNRCVRMTPPPAKIPCYATPDCPSDQCCKKVMNELRGECVLGSGC